MAQDKSIDELERDVEQARARVAADLALLRAPETYEAAKNGVMEAALGYRDQTVDDLVGTLRAKAVANPLAVAAIGAGVVWRLYKHPPIASLLVGLGVTALMRTDPHDGSMRLGSLMETASRRAAEIKDRAAAQIADLKEAAMGAIEEKTRAPMADAPIARGSDGAMWETEGVYASGRAERRDAYLLGVAALAVGAAVGLARLRHGEAFEDNGDRSDHHGEQRDGERATWRRL